MGLLNPEVEQTLEYLRKKRESSMQQVNHLLEMQRAEEDQQMQREQFAMSKNKYVIDMMKTQEELKDKEIKKQSNIGKFVDLVNLHGNGYVEYGGGIKKIVDVAKDIIDTKSPGFIPGEEARVEFINTLAQDKLQDKYDMQPNGKVVIHNLYNSKGEVFRHPENKMPLYLNPTGQGLELRELVLDGNKQLIEDKKDPLKYKSKFVDYATEKISEDYNKIKQQNFSNAITSSSNAMEMERLKMYKEDRAKDYKEKAEKKYENLTNEINRKDIEIQKNWEKGLVDFYYKDGETVTKDPFLKEIFTVGVNPNAYTMTDSNGNKTTYNAKSISYKKDGLNKLYSTLFTDQDAIANGGTNFRLLVDNLGLNVDAVRMIRRLIPYNKQTGEFSGMETFSTDRITPKDVENYSYVIKAMEQLGESPVANAIRYQFQKQLLTNQKGTYITSLNNKGVK